VQVESPFRSLTPRAAPPAAAVGAQHPHVTLSGMRLGILIAILCLAVGACVGPEDAGGEHPAAQDAASANADDGSAAAGKIDPTPVEPPPEDAELPSIGSEQFELHGRWRGDEFWARLSPYDERVGGRVLKLLYSPPPREDPEDTFRESHPWLRLDRHTRLGFWDERSNLTAAEYRDDRQSPGYVVRREFERQVGEDVFPSEELLELETPRAWPAAAVPVLLALTWRPEQVVAVPVVDLLGHEPQRAGNLIWRGTQVEWGARRWRVEADENGRLQRLLDVDETVILEVAGRAEPLPPAEAKQREETFLRALLEE